MRMNLEQTYKAVILKEMLQSQLVELENNRRNSDGIKMISKAFLRKLVLWSFLWMPIAMIVTNFVRNGFDPYIFIYAPVFLFYTAVYTGVIVSFIGLYNLTLKIFHKGRKQSPQEKAFYEQNKMAIQHNIKTVECKLKDNSSIISMYRSKDILEKLISYKKQGMAKTDLDAIDIYERSRATIGQTRPNKSRRKLRNTSKRIGKLARFLCMVTFASLAANSLNRSGRRNVW